MSQIQGALVGIAMAPVRGIYPDGLFGGSTGAIYRQFSITIVSKQWRYPFWLALILTCQRWRATCCLKPVSAEHHE